MNNNTNTSTNTSTNMSNTCTNMTASTITVGLQSYTSINMSTNTRTNNKMSTNTGSLLTGVTKKMGLVECILNMISQLI